MLDNEESIESYKLKCFICAKKILVQIVLMGVSHNTSVHATCAGCLRRKGLSKSYKEVYPEDAKDIEKWMRVKD